MGETGHSSKSYNNTTNLPSTYDSNLPFSVFDVDDSTFAKPCDATTIPDEDEYNKFDQLKEGLHSYKPSSPELKYLEDKVFPILLPIVEKTIKKAKKMDCLKHEKSLFNGIDYISQMLWNTNSKYPERKEKMLNIFLLPWTQEWLAKHPRPIFPKSWIWNKETAALKIQSYMRGYFVRRTEEVQEMRQFWKALKEENELNKEDSETSDKDSEIQIKHSIQ